MAELFAYRVVLNGIVLARSTPGVVFTGYMTYRASATAPPLSRLRYRASATRTSNEPFLSNEKHLGRRLKFGRLPPDPLN
jgi:hypothetical protein